MAQCAYCETESQLFENGKPICIKCDFTRSLISEVRKSSKEDHHGGASEESYQRLKKEFVQYAKRAH
jgi:hypothetical protein